MNKIRRIETEALEGFFSQHDVVLFGMSGVGKTSFVRHLQSMIPLRYVSIGEITRSMIKYHEEGDSVGKLIEKGGKWPLQAITGAVEPYLDLPSPWVLDGVPKYPDEANWLAEKLTQRSEPTASITLHLSPEEAHNRQMRRNNSDRPETPEQFADRNRVFLANHHAVSSILAPYISHNLQVDVSHLSPLGVIDAIAARIVNER